MDVPAPLEAKLQDYQAQVGKLLDRQRQYLNEADRIGREADLIKARIAGIYDALELLPKPIVAESVGVNATPARARKRNRPLSGAWQRIIREAVPLDAFDYDDLAIIAELVGHEVSRDNLRSQMSLYKNAGLVEAVGNARFRVTQLGAEASGLDNESGEDDSLNENAPPSGKPEDGADALEEGLDHPRSGIHSNPSPTGSTS